LNQKKKNIKLLGILLALIFLSVFVFLVGNNDQAAIEKNIFTLGENTVITTVILKKQSKEIQLEYLGGAWEVNSKYPMDESMRDVFFAVLSSIEVRRPVSKLQKDSIASFLEDEGTYVSITNNGQEVMSYLVGGNKDQFLTYFMLPDETQPYLMQIPGYLSFIAGIYEVSENDWRERYIWPMDWSRLKLFTIITPGKELVFEYVRNFIQVRGVEQMDTAAVMDFLQFSANLQAIKFLGQDTAYNNYLENKPYAQFRVQEIADRNYSLDIFEISDKKQFIGIINGSEKALFAKKDVQYLLKEKEEFMNVE